MKRSSKNRCCISSCSGLLFAAYGLLIQGDQREPGKIVVTQGQLASMMENFTLVRQRPPTREEWEGLIRDRVREEVYYREALALGLDKDDTIIRRRLQQKMEFVSDDIAAQAQPTDAELKAYLQAHPDKFRVEQQFTFRQLYLNPEKHGENLARDAAQLLAKLNQAGGDAGFAAMGDAFMLDHKFTRCRPARWRNSSAKSSRRSWARFRSANGKGRSSPASACIWCCVSERTEGRVPALADVRDAVRREWENARRLEANEKFYQDLLKHYTVTIEQPAAEAAKKVAVTK